MVAAYASESSADERPLARRRIDNRSFYLLVSALGAAAIAATLSSPAANQIAPATHEANEPITSSRASAIEENRPALPPARPTFGADEDSERVTALPPGHPPTDQLALLPSAEEANEGPLQWTAPSTWRQVENPNSMRLATYRLPRTSASAEEPELSITAAGGTPDSNIERWIEQFEEAGRRVVLREQREIAGRRAFIVGVRGTYLAGPGGGAVGQPPRSAEAKKPDFELLGAIVQAPSTLVFFKVTGPAAAVDKQKAGFDALLESLAIKPRRTL